MIWFTLWLIINSLAILANLRHLQTERERHRQLVLAYNQLQRAFEQGENTLDALSAVFQDSGRRMETRERETRQRLTARAEQLIVIRTAQTRNGIVEIARLFITETDKEFLRLRPGLWATFAEAVRDISEAWFYRAMAA